MISTNNFAKISNFYRKSKNLDINIKLIGNDAIFNGIEPRTFKQIESVLYLLGVNKIVINTDIYFGYKVPVGTVTISEGDFYGLPEVASSACGMCLLITPLTKEDILNKNRIEIQRITDIIGEEIAIKKKFIGNYFDLESVFFNGINHFNCPLGEKNSIEDLGIKVEYIPSDFFEEAINLNNGHGPSFGLLGSGNHFLEVMFVNKVYSDVARRWGLFLDQVVILIHSGASELEILMKKQYTNNKYIKKISNNIYIMNLFVFHLEQVNLMIILMFLQLLEIMRLQTDIL